MDSDTESGAFGEEFQLQREVGLNRQQRLQKRLDSARARLIQSSKDVATLASHEKFKRFQAQRHMSKARTHTVVVSQARQHVSEQRSDAPSPPAPPVLSAKDFAAHLEARQTGPSLMTLTERDVVLHILAAPTLDDIVVATNAWLRKQHPDSYSDEEIALFIIDESPRHAWSIRRDNQCRYSVERNVQIRSWAAELPRSRCSTSISEGISRAASIVGAAVNKRLMAVPCVTYDGTLMAYLQVDSRLLTPGKQSLEADVLLVAQVLGAKLQNMVMMHTSLPELHRLQCHELLTEFRPTDRRLVTLSAVQSLAENALHAVYGGEWLVHILLGPGNVAEGGVGHAEYPFHLAPGQDSVRASEIPEPALQVLRKISLPGKFATNAEMQTVASALAVKNVRAFDTLAAFPLCSEEFSTCAVACALRKGSLLSTEHGHGSHGWDTPLDDSSFLHMVWTELQASFDSYCENVQDRRMECANAVADSIFALASGASCTPRSCDWTILQFRLSRLASLYAESPELLTVNAVPDESDASTQSRRPLSAPSGTELLPTAFMSTSAYNALTTDGWTWFRPRGMPGQLNANSGSRNDNTTDDSSTTYVCLLIAELSPVRAVVLAVATNVFCTLDRHAQLVAANYPPSARQVGDRRDREDAVEPLRKARIPDILRSLIRSENAYDRLVQLRAACMHRILSARHEQGIQACCLHIAFKCWKSHVEAEKVHRSSDTLNHVSTLRSADVLTAAGAPSTATWTRVVQHLFGPLAEVNVQLVPADPARTDRVHVANRPRLDATYDDRTPGQVSVTCVVLAPNGQRLETTVRVVNGQVLKHQLAVLGATAQAFQQRITTCTFISPSEALADALHTGLAELLNDVLVHDTPYHEAATRFVAQLKQSIPLRRFDVQFGDDITSRIGRDSANYLDPAVGVATATTHGHERIYPLTQMSSARKFVENHGHHNGCHRHDRAECVIVAEDEDWDHTKELCVQQCRVILEVVHKAATHFCTLKAQHQAAWDLQMSQQAKLEQQAILQEESVEAAARVLDVLRRCVDTYCQEAQLASAALVDLPELAATLGAASCVLHRSDICDDDDDDDEEKDASRRSASEAGDTRRTWRIALADRLEDGDDNHRSIIHKRLPMLSVKGSASTVPENPIFRAGLVQIAKLCFYCRETKSVIAELSKVLREHSNLKGLALQSSAAASNLERSTSQLQVDLARALRTIQTLRDELHTQQEQHRELGNSAQRAENRAAEAIEKLRKADWLNLLVIHLARANTTSELEVALSDGLSSELHLSECKLVMSQADSQVESESRDPQQLVQMANECWEQGDPVLKHRPQQSTVAFPISCHSAKAAHEARACLVLSRSDRLFDIADLQVLGVLQPVLEAAVTRCVLLSSWEKHRSAEAAWALCTPALKAVCSSQRHHIMRMFENKSLGDAFSVFMQHVTSTMEGGDTFQHCSFNFHADGELPVLRGAASFSDTGPSVRRAIEADGVLLGTATMRVPKGESRILHHLRERIFSFACELFAWASQQTEEMRKATGTVERASSCVDASQRRIRVLERVIERELRIRTQFRAFDFMDSSVLEGAVLDDVLQRLVEMLLSLDFGAAAAVLVMSHLEAITADGQFNVVATSAIADQRTDDLRAVRMRVQASTAGAERDVMSKRKPVVVSSRASWFWRWCQDNIHTSGVDTSVVLLVPVLPKNATGYQIVICLASSSNMWSDHDCFVIEQLGQQLLWWMQLRDAIDTAQQASQLAETKASALQAAEIALEQVSARSQSYSAGITALAQWSEHVLEHPHLESSPAHRDDAIAGLCDVLARLSNVPPNQASICPMLVTDSQSAAPSELPAQELRRAAVSTQLLEQSADGSRASVKIAASLEGHAFAGIQATIRDISVAEINTISTVAASVMRLSSLLLSAQTTSERLLACKEDMRKRHDVLEHYIDLLRTASAAHRVCNETIEQAALTTTDGMLDYQQLCKRLNHNLRTSELGDCIAATLLSEATDAQDQFVQRILRLCALKRKSVIVLHRAGIHADDSASVHTAHEFTDLLVVETPVSAPQSAEDKLFLCIYVELSRGHSTDHLSEALLLQFFSQSSSVVAEEASETRIILQAVADGIVGIQQSLTLAIAKQAELLRAVARARSSCAATLNVLVRQRSHSALRKSWGSWLLSVSRQKSQLLTQQLTSMLDAAQTLEQQLACQDIIISVQAARGIGDGAKASADTCLKKLRSKWNSKFEDVCKLCRAGVVVPFLWAEMGHPIIEQWWIEQFDQRLFHHNRLFRWGNVPTASAGWFPVDDNRLIHGIQQLKESNAAMLELEWSESRRVLLVSSGQGPAEVLVALEIQPASRSEGVPAWVRNLFRWLLQALEPAFHLAMAAPTLRRAASDMALTTSTHQQAHASLECAHALAHEVSNSLKAVDPLLQCDFTDFLRAAVIASLQLTLHARDIHVAIGGELNDSCNNIAADCVVDGPHGTAAYHQFRIFNDVQSEEHRILLCARVPAMGAFKNYEQGVVILKQLLKMLEGLQALALVTKRVQSQLGQAMAIASGLERELTSVVTERAELQTEMSELAAQELHYRRYCSVLDAVADKPTDISQIGAWCQAVSANSAMLLQHKEFRLSFAPLHSSTAEECRHLSWSPPLQPLSTSSSSAISDADSQFWDHLIANAVAGQQPVTAQHKFSSGEVWWLSIVPVFDIDRTCVGLVGGCCTCEGDSAARRCFISHQKLCLEVAHHLGSAGVWGCARRLRLLSDCVNRLHAVARQPQQFQSPRHLLEFLFPDSTRAECGMRHFVLHSGGDIRGRTEEQTYGWRSCSEARSALADCLDGLPDNGLVFTAPIFKGEQPQLHNPHHYHHQQHRQQEGGVVAVFQAVLELPPCQRQPSLQVQYAQQLVQLVAAALQFYQNQQALNTEREALASVFDPDQFARQLRSLSRGLLAPYQVLRPGVVHEMPNVAEHVLAQAHAVLQEQLRRVAAAIGPKPRSVAQFVICHDFRPLNDLADTATSDLLYCVVTTEEVNILHWQELDPVAKTALQRPFDQDQPNGTYTVLTAGDTIWGLLHISCVVGERSLLVQQFTSYLAIVVSTMATLLHELPTQLNPTFYNFLCDGKRSIEVEQLQQIQLSNLHEAMEEERRMHTLLWDLVPSVLDQLLQKDESSTTPTSSCWELAARALLQLLTAVLPDAGISLQLATTGELKWDPRSQSIFASGLQASHSFHIENARQHPSYHQHVDGHVQDDVSFFVVPLRNNMSGDGVGVITIATPVAQPLSTQHQRAVEIVGIIASLTLSWCALVGEVREDIRQLCAQIQSLEQSVTDHAIKARLAGAQQQSDLQHEDEEEEEPRQRSDSFDGGISLISDHGRQTFRSHNYVHGGIYHDASLRASQREMVGTTPSRTALSMAIGRFLD